MKTGKVFFIILFSLLLGYLTRDMDAAFGQKVIRQGAPVPNSFCIKEAEMKLYRMVNMYRKQINLPPIPLSRSLCYVASLHVKDLFLHHPDQGPCNFHSWSKHGNWKPFCYPRDEDKKNSVWDKPREITRYPARAYEIVYWENNPLEADTILWVWKSESYFNDFLTNSGKWSGVKWGAIGIAVYENYACAWFGEATDPEGPVVVCGIPSKAPVSDSVKKVPKPHVSPKPIVKKIPDSLNKPKSAPSLKTGAMIPGSMDTISGKPSIKNDSLASQNITYFIIVKTNLPRTTAEKLLVNLKAEGYPDARILEKDNKIRISVFESAERTKVLGKLKEVKKTYKDAWLLKVIRN